MLQDDSFLMRGRRRKLVEELKKNGIKDPDVLQAIGRVKRHKFVLDGFVESAYINKALSIDEGQTISQPFTVAFQTQLLQIKNNDKVLEIGTGSGYQAAVLAEMNAQVFTIERIKKLYDKATYLLKSLGYEQIRTFYGDGYSGLPDFAPFDKIIITAAIPEIPKTLFDQLKDGGFLVAPVGIAGIAQEMKRFIKHSAYKIEEQTFGDFSFVPMLKGLK